MKFSLNNDCWLYNESWRNLSFSNWPDVETQTEKSDFRSDAVDHVEKAGIVREMYHPLQLFRNFSCWYSNIWRMSIRLRNRIRIGCSTGGERLVFRCSLIFFWIGRHLFDLFHFHLLFFAASIFFELLWSSTTSSSSLIFRLTHFPLLSCYTWHVSWKLLHASPLYFSFKKKY